MNTKYIAILCVDTSYVLIVPSLPPPPPLTVYRIVYDCEKNSTKEPLTSISSMIFFNLFYSIAFEKNKAEYLFQTNVKVITELRFYGTV